MKSKVLFPLLLIIFFTLSCKKGNDTYIKPLNVLNACGKEDPLNQLGWLNSKIRDGKDPSNINFVESVWIKEFEGEYIVIINFGLTSSVYNTYDCSGNNIVINNQDFYNSLSEDYLIYKY